MRATLGWLCLAAFLSAPPAAVGAADIPQPVEAVAVGDYDGDGFPDVAVGLPELRVGQLKDAGEVRVYAGKTGAMLWKSAGREEAEGRGEGLAAVGDVDGDGCTDLAVGSPSVLGGRVDFLSGKSGRVHHNFPGGRVFGFGDELCAIGDGSGKASVPVMIRAGMAKKWWYASSTNTNGSYSALIEDAAGLLTITRWLGDLDGDGLADMAICAWNEDAGGIRSAGRMRVLAGVGMQGTMAAPEDRGTARDPLTKQEMFTLKGTRAFEVLGLLAGPAGDWNRDGKGDLLIGAAGEEKAKTPWRVRVLSGADQAELWSATGSAGERGIGSVAAIGDANGDGKPDVAVGLARRAGDACAVLLLSGADGGVLWTLDGARREMLGDELYPAADADGDGVRDLWILAPGASLQGKKGKGYLRLVSGKSGKTISVVNPLEAK